MSWTLDGYPLMSGQRVREDVQRLRLPFLHNLDRAPSFMLPLGPTPARGYGVMLRQHIDAISLNSADHTLEIADNTLGGLITLHHIVIIKCLCLTPGTANDPLASYLVEFTDKRYLCHNPNYCVGMDEQYNVPAPNHDDYFQDTMMGGSAPWSWDTMVKDIWERMPRLGPFPFLPYSPDGEPKNFKYIGVSAWLALNQVLYKLGCAILPDLADAAAPYKIVRFGDPDSYNDALLGTFEPQLIYASDALHSEIAAAPTHVTVYFNTVAEHYGGELTTVKDSEQWLTKASYKTEVGDTAIPDAEPVGHFIWDDLLAVTDIDGNTTVTSLAEINARALEVVENYVRRIFSGGSGHRRHHIYTGIVPFRPGTIIKGVCWRNDSNDFAVMTEIFNDATSFVRPAIDSEDGTWILCDMFGESVALRPPHLGPQYPLYPQVLQLIKVVNGVKVGGVYDSSVVQTDPVTLGFVDKEIAWLLDAN